MHKVVRVEHGLLWQVYTALALLMVSGCHASSERTVVLYRPGDPAAVRQFACPDGACSFVNLDELACTHERADTVVVTGHSGPPAFLGRRPEQLAAAIACFQPQLVVLDTCYGFSVSLLSAMADQRITPMVVGATYKLPPAGLDYDRRVFFSKQHSAEQRAQAVHARSGARLERWRVDGKTLRAARAEVARWTPEQLKTHLQRIRPNLVKAQLPGSSVTALIDVPPERFRVPSALALRSESVP